MQFLHPSKRLGLQHLPVSSEQGSKTSSPRTPSAHPLRLQRPHSCPAPALQLHSRYRHQLHVLDGLSLLPHQQGEYPRRGIDDCRGLDNLPVATGKYAPQLQAEGRRTIRTGDYQLQGSRRETSARVSLLRQRLGRRVFTRRGDGRLRFFRFQRLQLAGGEGAPSAGVRRFVSSHLSCCFILFLISFLEQNPHNLGLSRGDKKFIEGTRTAFAERKVGEEISPEMVSAQDLEDEKPLDQKRVGRERIVSVPVRERGSTGP